jgi:MoxR-like ATPase
LTTWPIYRGHGEPHDGILELPGPPNWRNFGELPAGGQLLPAAVEVATSRILGERSKFREASQHEITLVNTALLLRRPLLVTGVAGVGKSSLAYDVAYELQLGRVLRWSINSRTTLNSGLYHYDPISRLAEENARQFAGEAQTVDVGGSSVGRHVRLGPLGTALLPSAIPRVLLIDEIDKSDYDLPNDLLDVFESGSFQIEELARLADPAHDISVRTDDPGRMVSITGGLVRCASFPIIILTSNGEREFPAAFLRRCVQLDLGPPDRQQLQAILRAQIGEEACDDAEALINDFIGRRDKALISMDQLLNAVFLLRSVTGDENTKHLVSDMIESALRPLADYEAQ